MASASSSSSAFSTAGRSSLRSSRTCCWKAFLSSATLLANSSLSFGVLSSSFKAFGVDRVGNKVLGFLVLSQDREEVLLLQSHLQLELLLQLREQALTRFDCVAGCHSELGEKLVRLGGTGLDQLSN